MINKGTLFLIPSLIAENTVDYVLPSSVINLISDLDEFIVEDERSARRFLKGTGYTKSLDSLVLHTLNKYTDPGEIPSFINSVLLGRNVGLLSEAGCPCIADPGSYIAELAHQYGIRVKPLTGPSSVLMALMASGFNGQKFAFNGYLPIEKKARKKKIKDLEFLAVRENQTQIFMETPFRNMQLLNDILNFCKPGTLLCIASEISSEKEFILTKTIGEWKNKIPNLHKKPVIFLLYKERKSGLPI